MDIINHPGRQALAPLAITRIEDSEGVSLTKPGITSDTALTLSGGGTANAVVWILDNGARFATASVTTNGTWEKSLIAAFGQHEFSLQEGASEWKSWGVTVEMAAVKPVIISVTGAGGPVQNGCSTVDRSLTLRGTSAANVNLAIYDGDTRINVTGSGSGSWTTAPLTFETGDHLLTARVGTLPSDPWAFTVQVAELPLKIDTSTMVLSGLSIKLSWPRTGQDSVGNTMVRLASDGAAPYRYSSGNPTVATVDGAGKVIGMSRGSAIITVTDQKEAKVSYPVLVSNVYVISLSETATTYAGAVEWMYNFRNEPFSRAALADMVRVYQKPFPRDVVNADFWCCTTEGCSGSATYYVNSSQTQACANPNALYRVIAIKPYPYSISQTSVPEGEMILTSESL